MGSILRGAVILGTLGGLVLHMDMLELVSSLLAGVSSGSGVPSVISRLAHRWTGVFPGEGVPTISSKMAEHIHE